MSDLTFFFLSIICSPMIYGCDPLLPFSFFFVFLLAVIRKRHNKCSDHYNPSLLCTGAIEITAIERILFSAIVSFCVWQALSYLNKFLFVAWFKLWSYIVY